MEKLSLKEYLNEVVKDESLIPDDFAKGRVYLAKHLLSEYLTDSKFCQCELCKKQHELIGLK